MVISFLILHRNLAPIDVPGNDDSLYVTAQIVYFILFLILVALILMNLLLNELISYLKMNQL